MEFEALGNFFIAVLTDSTISRHAQEIGLANRKAPAPFVAEAFFNSVSAGWTEHQWAPLKFEEDSDRRQSPSPSSVVSSCSSYGNRLASGPKSIQANTADGKGCALISLAVSGGLCFSPQLLPQSKVSLDLALRLGKGHQVPALFIYDTLVCVSSASEEDRTPLIR